MHGGQHRTLRKISITSALSVPRPSPGCPWPAESFLSPRKPKKKIRKTLALRCAAVERLPTVGKETTHVLSGGHRRASGACHGDGEPGEKKVSKSARRPPAIRRGTSRRFDEMREIKIQIKRDRGRGSLAASGLRTAPVLYFAAERKCLPFLLSSRYPRELPLPSRVGITRCSILASLIWISADVSLESRNCPPSAHRAASPRLNRAAYKSCLLVSIFFSPHTAVHVALSESTPVDEDFESSE